MPPPPRSPGLDAPVEVVLRLGRPPAEVLGHVVAPAALPRWLLGAPSADVVEAGLDTGAGCSYRLRFGTGRIGGGTFLGENVEVLPGHLVRRYRLAATGERNRPYSRTVTYDLTAAPGGGTALRCRVETHIPDLHPRLARKAARAERRAVQRTLARLGDVVERGRVRAWTRWRSFGIAATPL